MIAIAKASAASRLFAAESMLRYEEIGVCV
jgi:hypothetical protein